VPCRKRRAGADEDLIEVPCPLVFDLYTRHRWLNIINDNNQSGHSDTIRARYRIDRKRGPPREVEFRTAGGDQVTLMIVFDRLY